MSNLSAWIEFNPPVSLEKGKDYPFVGMDRIQPGVRYVRANTQRNFPSGGARFCHGDTLFARITPCLENGKIAQFIAEAEVCGFGSTEFFVLRAKENIADPAFVYYLAKTELLRGTAIQSMVGASGRQRADVESLRQLEIDLPDLSTQREIGKVLAYYDDLIETNHRCMTLLEESARLLYREWFVNLRFPGVVTKGENLPKGWTICGLGDLITLNYGKSLKDSTRVPGDVPVFGSSGVIGTHNQAIVNGPCLIVGRKGNVGSVYYSTKACFPIDTVYFVEGNQATFYNYLLLSAQTFVSSDTAVPGLNRTYAYSLPVLRPSQEVLALFERTVAPFFEQLEILNRQNASLQTARDALLPKLMSGAIQV